MKILIHYQSWHVLLSIIKLIPSAQQPPSNHIKGTPPNAEIEASNSRTWMSTQGE